MNERTIQAEFSKVKEKVRNGKGLDPIAQPPQCSAEPSASCDGESRARLVSLFEYQSTETYITFNCSCKFLMNKNWHGVHLWLSPFLNWSLKS